MDLGDVESAAKKATITTVKESSEEEPISENMDVTTEKKMKKSKLYSANTNS